MTPARLMNKLRMAIAEMVVETTEERVRAAWRSFGFFWRKPK